MVAVEDAQGALDTDGYGFPGFFGVVAQAPGSSAATDGTGDSRDKRVSFAPGARGPLGVVVRVGLRDVVIKVAQPGPEGGQRLPVEGRLPARWCDRAGQLAGRDGLAGMGEQCRNVLHPFGVGHMRLNAVVGYRPDRAIPAETV